MMCFSVDYKSMNKKAVIYIVAQNVKKLRKEKGLTQAQLAEKIDKTVEMISHLENCSAATKLSTLEDIARVFEVNIYKLFLDEENLLTEDLSEEKFELLSLIQDKSPEFIKSLCAFLSQISK